VDGPYINGNPSAGIQGSIIPAESIEFTQREIVNSVKFAGMVPTNDNLQQLWQATQRNPWLTHAALDTGTASALVATLNPSPIALFFGMVVRIKVAYDCVGASTLALNDLGAWPIIRANGAACQSGDFLTGEILNLNFDGAGWQIENWNGPPGVSSTINNYTTKIPYAVAGGGPNNLYATFNPTITSLVAGDPFLIMAVHANTTTTTLQIDSVGNYYLTWPDGAHLQNGDIRPGAILWVIFDGSKMQMLSVRYPQYAAGFACWSGFFSVPESTWVRAAPSYMNLRNTMRTSYFQDGVFTCGAGETGWWTMCMDSGYMPGYGGVTSESAYSVRITGPAGYFSQNNAQHSGNQGNSACVSCIGYYNEGDQAIFDVHHLVGSGAASVVIDGVRHGL